MNRYRVVPSILFLATLALPSFAQPAKTVQERLGYPATARLLIIHADDLGMAHSVNRATFEALENGWITSASIMVPTPWFAEAARWARAHPDADLGIHLTLNSEWADYRWGPVALRGEVGSLLDGDGYFEVVEEPVVEKARPEEVERELRAQVDKARAAGVRISHLDSHMATLFRSEPLFEVYQRLGRSYGIPLLIERQGARGGAESESAKAKDGALVDRVVSIQPGVPISEWPAAYEAILSRLPPGVYQLIVHLAYSDPEIRGATRDHPDWGAAWRQADLDLVRSDGFRRFLKDQGFVLIGWSDLSRALGTPYDRH
ncbi:MAG: polysaccharide deacetylase family protein [Thermoanaerobaculia bacterium]